MPKFKKTQNSFALGEISSAFFAQENSKGLSSLLNMTVLPSGGLTRRPGTVRLKQVTEGSVLIPFPASDSESYMLVVCNEEIRLYKSNGTLHQSLPTPWSTAEVKTLQYVQRFDTMIFVHPNHQPRILRKGPTGLFMLYLWEFNVNDNQTRNIPFMRFDDTKGVRFTVSVNENGNNFATLTADGDAWTLGNVGARMQFMDRQWVVYQYNGPRSVVVYMNGTYSLPGHSILDWKEAAFSDRRGWPCSIALHQNRLILGGSRSWPCGVWMSKTGDHQNFDVGTGLDDEAIFVTLLSSARQNICNVISSDNLQILTGEGEWSIANKPLTPSNLTIKQHTSVGSASGINICPQQIEGMTAFVSKSRREIRQLVPDDLAETYSAMDLCAMSQHLMIDPIGMSYDDITRRLYVVMQSGKMAVLTLNPVLGISAWSRFETSGEFKSVGILNGEVFVIVKRGSKNYLERFSDNEKTDAGAMEFPYQAAGLPLIVNGHPAKSVRVLSIQARLLDTKTLFFKQKNRSYRAELPNDIHQSSSSGFSGDTSLNLLGTEVSTIEPLWEITSDEQLPATILSITIDGRYSI
jgi:hypothetical protein